MENNPYLQEILQEGRETGSSLLDDELRANFNLYKPE